MSWLVIVAAVVIAIVIFNVGLVVGLFMARAAVINGDADDDADALCDTGINTSRPLYDPLPRAIPDGPRAARWVRRHRR